MIISPILDYMRLFMNKNHGISHSNYLSRWKSPPPLCYMFEWSMNDRLCFSTYLLFLIVSFKSLLNIPSHKLLLIFQWLTTHNLFVSYTSRRTKFFTVLIVLLYVWNNLKTHTEGISHLISSRYLVHSLVTTNPSRSKFRNKWVPRIIWQMLHSKSTFNK